MTNFRMRERFIRTPPALVEVGEPEPSVETVAEAEVAQTKTAPSRFSEPVSSVRFHPGLLTRDDCRTCSARRDELGRLPIGKCGPDCPVIA